MNIFRGVCVVLMIVLIVSCDAPRTNPLDPESPDYKFSTIEGTIKTQSSQTPMEGVMVTWKNQNKVVYTNSAGKFSFNKIDRIDGWIYFEKSGYSKDSTKVTIGTAKYLTVDKNLNAIPKLEEINMYTSIKNSYAQDPVDSLFIFAKVIDDEGDIDSVMVRNSAISLNHRLIYNSTTKYYERKYEKTQLKVTSLEKIIGTSFEFVAVDKNKKEFIVGSSGITRIISEQISCRYPLNNQSVNTNFYLEWVRFEPGFNFTYTTQIYTNELTPKLVWQKENISSNDIKITPSVKLPSGSYFWVIWCVDDFKNKSRSKPATFVVQ